MGETRAEYLLGSLEAAVDARLREVERARFAERIWKKDAALWKKDPAAQRLIAHRLGWLTVADELRGNLGSVHKFVELVRAEGFAHVLVLGMGGSSLAAETYAATFGQRAGFLQPSVLDSTAPASVRAAEAAMNLPHTLFLVASRSGNTRETLAFFNYFQERVTEEGVSGRRTSHSGRRFTAITNAGSPLETLARQEAFRESFLDPSDIGGRYSALSLFGIVPAALAGVDIGLLLRRGSEMAHASQETSARDNPPLALGVVLGEAVRAGHDKLTLLASPAVASLGRWIEQLVAESTGKEATGIVPVDGEPLGEPGVYDADRLFVGLLLGAHDPLEARLRALARAGHPVVLLHLRDAYDLGTEFFRWQFATAVAGALLGINPFDEPNVAESKQNTARILDGEVADPEIALGEAPGLRILGEKGGRHGGIAAQLAAFLTDLPPHGYLSVHAYLPREAGISHPLEQLRLRLRNRTRTAVTLGHGPGLLHSTGQLHKGGPPTGAFLQITGDEASVGTELAIPGSPYGFGRLLAAQAQGDRQALTARGRSLLHLELVGPPHQGFGSLLEGLDS